MSQSRLFVHLSDIHFDASGTTTKGPNLAARRNLLEDVTEGRRVLGAPDAVLVTGDIAFSGQEEQYTQARSYLGEITEALRIAPEQVQIVPGNHDVDRNKVTAVTKAGHAAIRAAESPDDDITLNDWLADPAEPLFGPLGEYNRFAVGYDCVVTSGNPYWEIEWPLGDDLRLLVRGLTTVLVSDANDRRANLVVGTTQTTLAEHGPKTVIMVLGHHPPDWWQDMDGAEAGLRRFASVHLYGHKHVHHLSVIDDSVRLVAGAVHPERRSDWRPRYNWVRLSADGEETDDPHLVVEIWPRVMHPSENEFRSDSRAGQWDPDVRRVPLTRLARVNQHVPEPAEVAVTEEQEPTDVAATAPAPPELAHRSPITDAAGDPTPLRRAVYRFMTLGFAVQTQILTELGLITDADRDATPQEQFLRAFSRARAASRVEDLMDRINAATAEQDAAPPAPEA